MRIRYSILYSYFTTLYEDLNRGRILQAGDSIFLEIEEGGPRHEYEVSAGGRYFRAETTPHEFSSFTVHQRLGWNEIQLDRLVQLCSQDYNSLPRGIWPVSRSDSRYSLSYQALLLFILHGQIGHLERRPQPPGSRPPSETPLFSPTQPSTFINNLYSLSISPLSGEEVLSFGPDSYSCSWGKLGELASSHVRRRLSARDFLGATNLPFRTFSQIETLAHVFNPEGYHPVPRDILVRLAAFLFIAANQLTPPSPLHVPERR